MTPGSRTSLSWSVTAWWWVALAVLVLNDHVLKGAGILPGWLTGKLSDLAGLVVAPMLAATVVGPRRPRARALAFALVVAAFVATKLTPSVARALEVVAGGVGVASRIWSDPTDLLALAVVPFTWRLATRVTRPLQRPTSRFGEALRVSLGAMACVATSQAPPDQRVPSAAFLGNLTSDPVAVQIFRAREPV